MDTVAVICFDFRLVRHRRHWRVAHCLGHWNRPPRQRTHLGIRRVSRLSLYRQPNRWQRINL